MKSSLKKYIDISICLLSGILLIMGSYIILINIYHASFINQKIYVREIDNDYKEFNENISKIENMLSEQKVYKNKEKILKVLELMKSGGIYKLLPGDVLKVSDLYDLNNYFIDVLINEGWISNLKLNEGINTHINNEYMSLLIKDANYLNKELLDNSNYHYDFKNNEIRDIMLEEYHFILKNYKNYSSFILNLCSKNGDYYA